MMLKVWKADEMQEYDVSYSLESGSGTFNSLFSAISEVSLCEIPEGACDCDGNILDECGVCNGDGFLAKCTSIEYTKPQPERSIGMYINKSI